MTLLEELRAAVLARSDYRRVRVSWDRYETLCDAAPDSPSRVYIGAHAVTTVETRTKYVVGNAVTVPEAAREYLRWTLGTARPIAASWRAEGWYWTAPIYCRPASGDFAYVDLRHAFWRIMEPYHLDDGVAPDGRVVLRGECPWLRWREVDETRDLRLAIGGAIFGHRVDWWERGQMFSAHAPAPWANPTLRRLTMATLHAIARTIRRRWGLHAWLTDAAVVDAEAAPDVLRWLLATWGLEARIDAVGSGEVRNATCYRVGRKHAKHWRERSPDVCSTGVLRRVDAESLRLNRLGL